MSTVFRRNARPAKPVGATTAGWFRNSRVLALSLAAAAGVVSFGGLAHAQPGAADAKKIFNQRCTACHTFGKGVKVGPDLKGVNDRRKRPWLLKFVRSSQGVIKGGDPVAAALFAQFKQQRMPDWTDLSEQQITAILDWFAANGPEQKELDERNAEVATPADLEMARGLFQGRLQLASGGVACGACHSIRDNGEMKGGGSLGPELSGTYLKYQDRALTLFLKRPCFSRMPERVESSYLTPQESFALKAYLRQASLSQRQAQAQGAQAQGEGKRVP
jgi:cytochrome c2